MHRIRETVKNIIIALLLLTSLFLVVLALPASIVAQLPLPDRISAFLGVQSTPDIVSVQSSKLSPAATPLTISIRHSGGRHTVRRDAAALSAAYDALSVYLGRCLAGAQEGKPLSQEDVLAAMEQPGVLFTYPGTVPTQALCRWLTDTDGSVHATSRDYLLQADGRTLRLIVCGNTPMQYETNVSAAGLLSALESYTPDSSGYAFAHSSHLHPLTLWEQTVQLPVYTAENPVDAAFSKNLATALDFNPYGAGTYTDPKGNTVFSETSRTLSVSADGTVTLTVSEPGISRFTASSDTPAAKIETARALVDTISRDTLGAARLLLAGYDETAVRFTYVLGGVKVSPAACTAQFSGADLTQITLTLRSYHPMLGQSRLMPLSSAAAITEAGTRPEAAYSLSAEAGWAID